jgi:hypothetical protein
MTSKVKIVDFGWTGDVSKRSVENEDVICEEQSIIVLEFRHYHHVAAKSAGDNS